MFFMKQHGNYLQINNKNTQLMDITLKMITQKQVDPNIILQKDQISSKETLQAYQAALTFSNLVLEHQISFRNVKIYENDHIHEIYTTNQENKKLQHLVMLHGFGGTAIHFIRTFQHLRQHFHVHALDTFGVGLSSIGNFHSKFTAQQAGNYYIQAIEEWRKALKIDKIVLLGHSFGGYIATLYTQKYPSRVTKLILLSPAGGTKRTKQQIEQEITRRKGHSFGSKVFFCIGEFLYNRNIRPFGIMDTFIIGKKFINTILTNRLKLQQKQKQAWTKYLKQIAKKQNTSETGFYKLFQWPVAPKRSIQEIIEQNNFKIKISFYFGQSDWMDRVGGRRLSQKYENITFTQIQNAGHQLIFDNPLEVVQKIIGQKQFKEKQKEGELFNPEILMIKNKN